MEAKTILLVDDNEELREASRDLLVALGYEVSTASRGEEAIRLFATEPPFDALVSGLAMPGMDGVELAHRLLSRRGDLGVVLMTSGRSEAAFGSRIEAERLRCLRKPFSAAELRAAVEESLTARWEPPEWPRPEAGTAPGMPAVAPIGPAGRFRAAWGLVAAASLVLVVGVLLRTSELSAPTLPEVVESGVGRGGAPELLDPVGELAEPPAEMVWEEVAGAERYRIRILDVDDSLLWEDTADAGRIVFPRDFPGGFHPGVVYTWQVETLGAGGEVLTRSSSARFRVTPGRRRARPSASADG